VFDDKAAQMAFLSDRDTYKDNPAIYELYYWTPAAEAGSEIASGHDQGQCRRTRRQRERQARVLQGRRPPVLSATRSRPRQSRRRTLPSR